jgi:hypothetical protein
MVRTGTSSEITRLPKAPLRSLTITSSASTSSASAIGRHTHDCHAALAAMTASAGPSRGSGS